MRGMLQIPRAINRIVARVLEMAEETRVGGKRSRTIGATKRVNGNLLLAMRRCIDFEVGRRSILLHRDAAHGVPAGRRSIHDFHSAFEPKAKGAGEKDFALQFILGLVRLSGQKFTVKDTLHEEIFSAPEAFNLLVVLAGTVERVHVEAEVGRCGIKASRKRVPL
jgi:hypothetical protein